MFPIFVLFWTINELNVFGNVDIYARVIELNVFGNVDIYASVYFD